MHARQFTKRHSYRPVDKCSQRKTQDHPGSSDAECGCRAEQQPGSNRTADGHHSHLPGTELMAQSLFLVEFFSHGHALSYIRNLLRTKELLWCDLRNRDTPLLHCWPPTATLESQLGYSARYRSLSWQIQPSEWIEQRLQSAWSGRKNFSRRAKRPMPCKSICRCWQTIPRTTMFGKWRPSFVFPCSAPVKL